MNRDTCPEISHEAWKACGEGDCACEKKMHTIPPVNDGGLAFPLDQISCGMTLRDYFAAAALQGYMAGSWMPKNKDGSRPIEISVETWAEEAYAIADAMLAERERTLNEVPE